MVTSSKKPNKMLQRTIQSGTCFAKKAAKTCHFELPLSMACVPGMALN